MLALKLAKVSENLIHKDQAGFVLNRSLYDHTKTINLAIEYCEMMDKNRCIVALDQEKAYDKIDHEYLWRILNNYEFPGEFINRIKELYKEIGKAILVNGVATKQSNLGGIRINKDVKRLIVSLFADDTLVYLSATEKLDDLREIKNIFCKASTAIFNMEKKKQNTFQ